MSMAPQIMNKMKKKKNIYDISDLEQDVKYIMDQYICDGAEDRVNLSSSTRLEILSKYHSLNGQQDKELPEMVDTPSDSRTAEPFKELFGQYVTLFDNGLEEVATLMRSDSLIRFYLTQEYKNMIRG